MEGIEKKKKGDTAKTRDSLRVCHSVLLSLLLSSCGPDQQMAGWDGLGRERKEREGKRRGTDYENKAEGDKSIRAQT